MEPTDENRQLWDRLHAARQAAPPGPGLPGPVRHSLGDLTKKRVLHISCGTGEASADLAELGAVVTGVDPSEERLEVARERVPSILWIQAEPDALPRELKRARFELVYCAPGTLAESTDLDGLVRGVCNALYVDVQRTWRRVDDLVAPTRGYNVQVDAGASVPGASTMRTSAPPRGDTA